MSMANDDYVQIHWTRRHKMSDEMLRNLEAVPVVMKFNTMTSSWPR